MHEALARALAREIIRERSFQTHRVGERRHPERGPLRRALGRAGRNAQEDVPEGGGDA